MTVYALDGITPTLPGDNSHWIAPNATLIGKVIIGRQVAILFGSVLRGDNEPITIGDGTNIQDNSVLHTDLGYPLTLGRDCTVGHLCLLHGCRIADNALIGMGSTILNGATIGKNSVIGAGSLVTEGRTVKDNALYLGRPAKFVRTVDRDEHDRFLEAAAHYRANITRYRRGLASA